MLLSVVNNSGIDIDLYVGAERHRVFADEQPQDIKVDDEIHSISVKKVIPSPPPNYNQLLLSEILGGVARLFPIEHTYIADISAQYRLSCVSTDFAELTIIGERREPLPEIAYDALRVVSSDLDLADVHYVVDNKSIISSVYKKSRFTAHACMFALIELLFVLAGIGILYPILLALYSATNMLLFKLLMMPVPFVLGGLIALIVILPLYFIHKYEDKDFYNYMEHKSISSILEQ